ncbi:MAG: hypothetical protein ACOYJ2_02405 [Rickettsiales bacterium]
MIAKRTATPLTEAMIDSFPAIDPHIHVPGTISPQTAWDLGLRNNLIHMERTADGKWVVVDGPNSIGPTDPVKKYSRIFVAKGGHELTFDRTGNPIDLDYNYFCLTEQPDKFSGFDAIQGTTQGHRHRPGGIQNESDYRFVMERFLESCLKQNLRYVEPSQNITIAKVLYPDLPDKGARRTFFALCKEIVAHYEKQGVILRFTHCANKTGAANVPGSLTQRSNEWVDWLEQAQQEIPGIFVGMTTAGHEGMEIKSGGPDAMAQAYHRLKPLGLKGEGHYGEGAGVEHLLRALDSLHLDRLAHAVQMVESPEAIRQIRERRIPVIMMPYINLSLGTTVHYKGETPHSKFMPNGIDRDPDVEKRYLSRLEEHPFFTLMRRDSLPIALASDDPQQGGIDYKDQVKMLAGLTYEFESGFIPLSAEELTLCNLNAIEAAFCEASIKPRLIAPITEWLLTHQIHVRHPLLTT